MHSHRLEASPRTRSIVCANGKDIPREDCFTGHTRDAAASLRWLERECMFWKKSNTAFNQTSIARATLADTHTHTDTRENKLSRMRVGRYGRCLCYSVDKDTACGNVHLFERTTLFMEWQCIDLDARNVHRPLPPVSFLLGGLSRNHTPRVALCNRFT